jgi:hypothetical protein
MEITKKEEISHVIKVSLCRKKRFLLIVCSENAQSKFHALKIKSLQKIRRKKM